MFPKLKQLVSADEPSLLQGLQERPLDEAAWMVYADWLEENGESRRANFYRRWVPFCVELWTKRETNILEWDGMPTCSWSVYVDEEHSLVVTNYVHIRMSDPRWSEFRVAVTGWSEKRKSCVVRISSHRCNPTSFMRACRRVCARIEELDSIRASKKRRYEKKLKKKQRSANGLLP